MPYYVVLEIAGFQSTLPRRERLHLLTQKQRESLISIHAPAKGATTRFERNWQHLRISIHAPAKGATMHRNITGVVGFVFQSTLPRRERRF